MKTFQIYESLLFRFAGGVDGSKGVVRKQTMNNVAKGRKHISKEEANLCGGQKWSISSRTGGNNS